MLNCYRVLSHLHSGSSGIKIAGTKGVETRVSPKGPKFGLIALPVATLWNMCVYFNCRLTLIPKKRKLKLFYYTHSSVCDACAFCNGEFQQECRFLICYAYSDFGRKAEFLELNTWESILPNWKHAAKRCRLFYKPISVWSIGPCRWWWRNIPKYFSPLNRWTAV